MKEPGWYVALAKGRGEGGEWKKSEMGLRGSDRGEEGNRDKWRARVVIEIEMVALGGSRQRSAGSTWSF